MKRKSRNIAVHISECVSSCTRSKKPKICKPLFKCNNYISATRVKNFMLNDTLVDWLYEHKNVGNSIANGFDSFIINKGVEFEKELIKYIIRNKAPVVYVSDKITDESVQKTIDLMHEGTPLIHSAPVRNDNNNTHGIIDLLVRSDYLHKIVEECPITIEEQKIPSPKLKKDYHYVVIDVKFSTLPLRADGKHLLNSDQYPAYKAQCLIYRDAVSLIQGYTSQYAFILGRRWKYTHKDVKHTNFTCLNKLGVIDYKNVDEEYVEKTSDALKWIRDNKKNGHKWSVSPPSRKELYPNMCSDSGKWQTHKDEIAQNIGEISSIWYCGVKHRNIGLSKGIKSWKDLRCNSKNIGINGKRGSTIDEILNINRQDVDVIRPKKIINNICDWKTECNEIFVDFETLPDIFCSFSDLPVQNQTDIIFMIGVYWKKINSSNSSNSSSEWTYTNFTCNEATYEEEYRIMNEFNKFVKIQNNPKLWYWCADDRFWKKSEQRHLQSRNNSAHTWKVNNWVDMYQIFTNEPIVIKDCFNFGLKNIAKTMKKHGLINTTLNTECNSGVSAMILAHNFYEKTDKTTSVTNNESMKQIIDYNKFDVEVLYDILNYLRTKHS